MADNFFCFVKDLKYDLILFYSFVQSDVCLNENSFVVLNFAVNKFCHPAINDLVSTNIELAQLLL